MLQDISYAIRSLRRQPGFALLAMLVLALGIGSATAIATVYNAVLLQPLPMAEQDRLVVMWGVNRARKFDHIPVFNRQVRAFEERSRAFSSVAAADYNGAWPRLFRERGEPVELIGVAVSGDFFDVLGTTAFFGRVLRPEDDVPGAAPSMVISHAAWRQRFGGDTAIVGRQLQLVASGTNFTIVGVLPPGFEYPRGAELWATIHGTIEAKNADPRALVDVIGRLRHGATLEMARREMEALFAEDSGAFFRGVTAVAHTLPDRVIGEVRPALRILAVAVGLLLLVACVNVANLFLIRGVERSREMAVRSALGAGRARLTRQLLTESSIVGFTAGIVGGLIAIALLRILIAAAPAELPRLGEIRVADAALWAAATTFVATVLFGAAPALWTAGKRVGHNLVGSSRWATERGAERIVKDVLVAGQLALAILILTSAGLVARSLLRLQRLELGYSTERLLVAQLGWPNDNFRDVPAAIDMYEELIAEVQQIPGVVGAAPLLIGPFSGTGGWDGAMAVEGQSNADATPIVNMEIGSPTFFATMGIPLRSGRVFSDRDRRGAPLAIVVSEGAAKAMWPGQDAIGKRLVGAQATELWTVIGVVADTRYREYRTPRATVYFPLQQIPFPYPPTNLVVRTAGDPALMAETLRRAIANVDPDLVLSRATTMTSLLDEPLAQPRLNAMLLALFAVVVLLLSVVGLYGVLAWTVRQRTRELGIRIALGAQPRQLQLLVLRRGVVIAGVGVIAGLVGAFGASRVLQALLYEISPTDPLTMVLASALLLSVAIAACLIPARRATRVDPMIALRAE